MAINTPLHPVISLLMYVDQRGSMCITTMHLKQGKRATKHLNRLKLVLQSNAQSTRDNNASIELVFKTGHIRLNDT